MWLPLYSLLKIHFLTYLTFNKVADALYAVYFRKEIYVGKEAIFPRCN